MGEYTAHSQKIMTRQTTISVSYDEKQRLDEAAEELCGTTEVPYGAVVAQLVEESIDG